MGVSTTMRTNDNENKNWNKIEDGSENENKNKKNVENNNQDHDENKIRAKM